MRPEPTTPAAGQESVWAYPRPPRIEPFSGRIEVHFGGELILSTGASWRLLETSHPPVYYLPVSAAKPGALRPAPGSSFCEWKGSAHYFDVFGGCQRADRAAWGYKVPSLEFGPIAGHVAIYASLMDTCLVDGEVVTPQPGGFYGGWITSKQVGPFKGVPGSSFW